MEKLPLWITELEGDELLFIKRFVMASGSLKEIANIYDVTYPTVRNRLNGIIEKLKMCDENREDDYVRLIKKLTLEDKIDFEAATLLIHEYRSEKEA